MLTAPEFPREDLEQKLAAYDLPDAESWTQDIVRSVRVHGVVRRITIFEHGDREAPFVYDTVSVVVERLLRKTDGLRLAYELCMSLKLEGSDVLLDEWRDHVLSSQGALENRLLDECIARLANGRWVGSFVERGGAISGKELDPCAARRRLWTSIAAKGCRDTTEESRVFWSGFPERRVSVRPEERSSLNCRCHRRMSLRLLYNLQVTVYNKVRCTVALTLGTLVPADICELLFESAMAAEECPLDPRVTVAGVNTTGFFEKNGCELTGRPRYHFQRAFCTEYRCPRFQEDEAGKA